VHGDPEDKQEKLQFSENEMEYIGGTHEASKLLNKTQENGFDEHILLEDKLECTNQPLGNTKPVNNLY
jgi:hypothetical protein